MSPFIAYLLKMVLVSGVLYAYYHVVLRDKRFHQWNRFYLLSAVFLSITLPLIHIQVQKPVEDNTLLLEVLRLMGNVKAQTTTVTVQPSFWASLTWNDAFLYAYLGTAGALLIVLAVRLLRIRKLHHDSPHYQLEKVTLVETRDAGTPFSFFNWIFWNSALKMDSAEGQRILRHELTHVRQQHSLDKMILQFACILFFPVFFFYLIRKELQLIHEYLADKQATRDEDLAEYAQLLISQAFQVSPYVFANSFFQHPLKRRIAMMTRFHNPRFTYLRKVLFLPLSLGLFGLLAFRVDADHPNLVIRLEQASGLRSTGSPSGDSPFTISTALGSPGTVSLASGSSSTVSLRGVDTGHLDAGTKADNMVRSGTDHLNRSLIQSEVSNVIKTQSVVTAEFDEKSTPQMPTKWRDTVPAEQVDGSLPSVTVIGYSGNKTVSDTDTLPTVRIIGYSTQKNDPLIVIDGKPSPPASNALHTINPSSIESITVLKDASATSLYGDAGKNGVILISTKKGNSGRDTTPAAITIRGLTPASTDDDNKIFTKVEIEARFPGDEVKWNKYVQETITSHISELQKDGLSGTCELLFVVNKDGSVTGVQALSMQGSVLAKICVNAIANGPRWVPAYQNGHAVKAFRKQKITFQMP